MSDRKTVKANVSRAVYTPQNACPLNPYLGGHVWGSAPWRRRTAAAEGSPSPASARSSVLTRWGPWCWAWPCSAGWPAPWPSGPAGLPGGGGRATRGWGSDCVLVAWCCQMWHYSKQHCISAALLDWCFTLFLINFTLSFFVKWHLVNGKLTAFV